MHDEFDDAFDDEALRSRMVLPEAVCNPAEPRVGRLIARVYAAAGAPLRARILGCLVKPLGTLSLVTIASGAFSSFLHRRIEDSPGIPVDELGRYSVDQIAELARFVEQVSPDALRQVAGLLGDSPIGAVAFSTAVAMLLVRAVRGPTLKSTGSITENGPSVDTETVNRLGGDD